MTFDEKLTRFHAELEAGKLRRSILDPYLWSVLRFVGIKAPPPVFQPMWLNLVIVFLTADVALTTVVVIWPMFFPEVPLMGLLIFAFISTIASAVMALVMSLVWWQHKIRLELPDWDSYGVRER